MLVILQENTIEEFTDEQKETAETLAERGDVTVWLEENGNMGLTLIEDGVHQTAFFDKTGTIIGDWIV